MAEAASVAADYAVASTGASEVELTGTLAEVSAEDVEVSAVVLVGWSIGHLVRCR